MTPVSTQVRRSGLVRSLGVAWRLVARATYRDRDRNHPPRRLQDFRGTTGGRALELAQAGHSKTEIQAWTDHVVGLADVNVDIRQGERLWDFQGLESHSDSHGQSIAFGYSRECLGRRC